ncbi:MAG: response regulator [Desulfatibacillaceae bacterium]
MSDRRPTILFVDDEVGILSALKRVLRKENFRVLLANSGEHALEILEKEEVQVVVSDQRMPGMNGTELMAVVKRRHPDAVRIILSGYTEVDSITESVNKGNIYKFFLKPWNDEALKTEIHAALEQWRRNRRSAGRNGGGALPSRKSEGGDEPKGTGPGEAGSDDSADAPAFSLCSAVLNGMAEPVVAVCEDGTVLLANKAAKRYFLNGNVLEEGNRLPEGFPSSLCRAVSSAARTGKWHLARNIGLGRRRFRVVVTPMGGSYAGKGAVLTMTPLAGAPDQAEL